MWICSSGLGIVPEKAVALAAESSHYAFVPAADWLLIKGAEPAQAELDAELYICIPSWKWTQSGHSCILPRCLLVADALGDCRKDFLLRLYEMAFIGMVSVEIRSIWLKCRWDWKPSSWWKPVLWTALGLVPLNSRFEIVPGPSQWCQDGGEGRGCCPGALLLPQHCSGALAAQLQVVQAALPQQRCCCRVAFLG